jgi:protein-tyrosine phosphatase
VFIDIEPLLVDLRAACVEVIIAHPERNSALPGQFARLHQWLHEGARLQVTAGSLTGRFGPAVQRVAWDLLTRGWVAFVGTDAHNEQVDGPVMTTAFRMIATHMSLHIARRLCVENPSRLIADGQPPVSALAFDEWGAG